MPRCISNPTSWSESSPLFDEAEPVSSGTWRIPLMPWQFLVIIGLIAALAVFTRNDFGGSHAGSFDSSQLESRPQRLEAAVFSPDGRTLAACRRQTMPYACGTSVAWPLAELLSRWSCPTIRRSSPWRSDPTQAPWLWGDCIR